MRALPPTLRLCWLVLIAWAAPAAWAGAQERVQKDAWVRGYHGFTELCRALGLEPIPPQEIRQWRATPPRESALVIFGALEWLPVDSLEQYVRQGGAVLVATDRGNAGGGRLPGLFFVEGPLHATEPEAAFQTFFDCPLATDLDADHPLTRSVRSVATNRPGAIEVTGRFGPLRWETPARLPPLRKWVRRWPLRMPHPLHLLAAAEAPGGGRIAAAADQSLFANQMLLFEDNALLAMNVVSWLKEPGRSSVLILDERSVIAPPGLEETEVELPPPTPEEVMDALRNLPPEALIDFGNAVVTAAEDEGILNEAISFLIRQIPQRHYARLLLFLATMALAIVVARRLFTDAAPDGAVPEEDEPPARRSSRRRALERQQAAQELLEQFRIETAGSSAIPWKVLAARLQITGQPWATRRLRRNLLKASRRLAPEAHRYWTRRRLAQLIEQLRRWGRLRASGELEYAS